MAHVIIEEAHHLLSDERRSLVGGQSVMEITFREIREFGESLILLDQHPLHQPSPPRWSELSQPPGGYARRAGSRWGMFRNERCFRNPLFLAISRHIDTGSECRNLTETHLLYPLATQSLPQLLMRLCEPSPRTYQFSWCRFPSRQLCRLPAHGNTGVKDDLEDAVWEGVPPRLRQNTACH